MSMNEHWRNWLKESFELGCDPFEIKDVLLKHYFSPADIETEMGDRYPRMKTLQMDESWKEWTRHNLERGCNPEVIRDTLLENHFTLREIRIEMGGKYPYKQHVDLGPEAYEKLANIKLTRTATPVDTDGKAQIYIVENFMTPEECEQLIAISSQRLRASTVARQEQNYGFRTSSTCDLVYINHPLVLEIRKRIGETLGINPTYSEGIQVQRYEIGQLFKPHMDYFTPYTPDYDKYAGTRGNRTWTFMVYLNDTPKGGGTGFTKLDKTFYPKTGMAVVWNNYHADGTLNPETIHTGMAVEEGYKVIITDWYRELGEGEMFLPD